MTNEGIGSRGAGTPQSAVRPAAAPLPALGWAGGWVAVLALALWMRRLEAAWLALAAASALLFLAAQARARPRWALAASAALWLTVGAGAGVQLRLDRISTNWDEVRADVEERAAERLRESLGRLVDRGERAVAGAALAAPPASAEAGEAVFQRLERVRAKERVAALALFDSTGSAIAWSGDHRGAVPREVRRGERMYFFAESPLFGYLYFVRRLESGETAVAMVLMSANLPPRSGVPPFAEQFAERYGITPQVLAPERAHGTALWDWSTEQGPILSVSFQALTQERWWGHVAGRGRWAVALPWLAAWALLVGAWYRRRTGVAGLPVALTTLALLLMPVGRMLGTERLFSTLRFLLPGPAGITLGELLIILCGGAVWLLARPVNAPRNPPPLGRWKPALVALGSLVVILPALLWLLDASMASGLLLEDGGGGLALQLAATLLLAFPLYLLLRPGSGREQGGNRYAVLAGLALASLLGMATVLGWRPGRELPIWAGAFWVVPTGLVLWGWERPRVRAATLIAWLAAGLIAASLALPFIWTRHMEARVVQAEGELARLGTEPDPYLDFLLRQFAEYALSFAADGDQDVDLLYHAWVSSGLAREGYEARITTWVNGRAGAELRLSDVELPPSLVGSMLRTAAAAEDPVLQRFTQLRSVHYLLLVPLPGGRVISVAVPPRQQLARTTALARFLQPAEATAGSADYELLSIIEAPPGSEDQEAGVVHWVPTAEGWRSEAPVHFPAGLMHAHLLLRTTPAALLLARGALLGAALLGVMLLLGALARTLCDGPYKLGLGPFPRSNSFRGRLTLALFGFFLIPTATFGAVAYSAASREVARTASALASRSLAEAAAAADSVPLSRLGARLGADLLLYRRGTLAAATAGEALELGIFQSWLPRAVYLDFTSAEDDEAQEAQALGGKDYLVAYRRLGPDEVLAAPIALASGEVARRQGALGDVLLFMCLLGAALSVVLSLGVGRALTRPLEELRRASARVGAGNLGVQLPENRSDEFGGVYRSFNTMVARLRRARSALVRQTRRTELIVAEAATGLLALDAAGRVALVNPRAREILGERLEVGAPLPERGPLLGAVTELLRGARGAGAGEQGEEIEVEGRTVRLRLRVLRRRDGSVGAAVVALEDITSEVRTARVLAWGEMARQVAHEIKNPLTPIKLSVQHLRRAYGDRRPDFDEILERNVDAILREIDRLGEIARAFARFGTPAAAAAAGEPVPAPLGALAEETLALYRGGDDGIEYRVQVDPAAPPGIVRVGEFKEVLVNLLENAREALHGGGVIEIRVAPAGGGAWVAVDVADTGEGIAPEMLPHIFEPRFSTRTSGTGLGLAIVRRLVEGWGGEVTAESAPGTGTTVHLRVRAGET